jgi:N-acetylmuramoyl-L-alanine amidase
LVFHGTSGRTLRVWPYGLTVIAVTIALLLLPFDASRAGFLSDLLKGSSKAGKPPPKHAAAPKHAVRSKHVVEHERAAAPKPNVAEKPAPSKYTETKCDPAKFRLIVDVGHTVQSDGAMSARNVPEFQFNLQLAQRLVDKLKSEGFATTRLLVTEGKARPSLFTRVASANNWHADLFLSIHHDSVPDKLMENWEFEGKKSHFSDRFSGYGLFVSKENPDFETSLRFAKLIGTQMHARDIKFADQYTLPIMGKYRHDLLDRDAGIYRYDHLIVLQRTHMPAVLLEAGSIINRDEELQMASPERQDMIVNAVTTAVEQFCGLPKDAPQAMAPVSDSQAAADRK